MFKILHYGLHVSLSLCNYNDLSREWINKSVSDSCHSIDSYCKLIGYMILFLFLYVYLSPLSLGCLCLVQYVGIDWLQVNNTSFCLA